MRNIIVDGYQEHGYVAARAGINDAVRFKYRPLLHIDRSAVNVKIASGSVEGPRAVYSAIKKHVESWDVKDADGKVALIELETIMHLRPMLVEAIWSVISGWAPSDRDPLLPLEKQEENDEISNEAWLAQQREADRKEKADAKNSVPA